MIDAADRGKLEKQHEQWTQQVYGAIQSSINEQIDAIDPRCVDLFIMHAINRIRCRCNCYKRLGADDVADADDHHYRVDCTHTHQASK